MTTKKQIVSQNELTTERQEHKYGNMTIWVADEPLAKRVRNLSGETYSTRTIYLEQDAQRPVGMIRLYKGKAELYTYGVLDSDEDSMLIGCFVQIGTFPDIILAKEVLLKRINPEFVSPYKRETLMSVTTVNFTVRLDEVRGGYEVWKGDQFITRGDEAHTVRGEFLRVIGMDFFFQPREMHLVTEGVARRREVEAGEYYEKRAEKRASANIDANLSAAKDACREMREMITKLEKENSDLNLKHQQLFDEARMATRAKKTLEGDLAYAKAKIKDLEIKLETAKGAEDGLAQQIIDLRADNESLEVQVHDMLYKLGRAEAQTASQGFRFAYLFPKSRYSANEAYINTDEVAVEKLGKDSGMYTFGDGVQIVALSAIRDLVACEVIDLAKYWIAIV